MWAWKGRVISVFDRNQGLCLGTLITKFALSLYNYYYCANVIRGSLLLHKWAFNGKLILSIVCTQYGIIGLQSRGS